MLFLPLFAVFQLATASSIATFTDSNCKDSFRDITGPNGYPNGTCQPLNIDGPYQSFQVVGLDPECTVTIYAQDQSGDICSSTAPQIEANIGRCYDTSWVYYSIDGCAVPSSSSGSSSGSTDSSTSKTPSSVGPIVGGVVGGVVAVAIILVAAIYFWRKKKRDSIVEAGDGNLYEMSAAEERKEMPVDGLYGHFGGELQGSKPSSVKISPMPPVELPADHHRSISG